MNQWKEQKGTIFKTLSLIFTGDFLLSYFWKQSSVRMWIVAPQKGMCWWLGLQLVVQSWEALKTLGAIASPVPIARKQQVLGMGPWVFVSGFSVLFSLLPNCRKVAFFTIHFCFQDVLPLSVKASIYELNHPKLRIKIHFASLKFLLLDIWSWRQERLARLVILQTVDLICQSTNSTHTHVYVYTYLKQKKQRRQRMSNWVSLHHYLVISLRLPSHVHTF